MTTNEVRVEGAVAERPTLRRSRAGLPILEVLLRVPDVRRSRTGDWEEATCFVPCVAFGGLAEELSDLARGDWVTCAGKLSWSNAPEERLSVSLRSIRRGPAQSPEGVGSRADGGRPDALP